MVMGISFGRGVFFHDRNVLACAEVKRGVIHVWAEKITLQTIGKLWVRVCFSLPWYYHLFHLGLLGYLVAAWLDERLAVVNPWWLVVYLAGFHFVFPRQLKQFHGAEHKVFSHGGAKNLDALEEIRRADIVNAGCSTNLVMYFFASFLLTLPFAGLEWGVAAGIAGTLLGMWGEKYLRRYAGLLYKASAFCQRHLTTKEPDRIHLETAIRSYQMFEHVRSRLSQAA
jgi:hypothetical protein